MSTPTQTQRPGSSPRPSGWATRRTPLWVFAALAVVAVGVLLVSLSHRPSDSQRAADLTGYFRDVRAGIGSCAAGLHDSQNAYRQVRGGDTAHLKTAESVFTFGGTNCTVAGNQALTDFAGYQVTESLSSLNLDAADNDVITWSFDATEVQQDMLAVVRSSGAARANAETTLASGLAKLDAERAAIDAIWSAAKHATGATSGFPGLPA
jgi:hypothetical protein